MLDLSRVYVEYWLTIEICVFCFTQRSVCIWFTLFLDLGFLAVAGPVLDHGWHSKSGCLRPGPARPSLALGVKTSGPSDPPTPNEPRRQVRLLFRVIMSISTVLMMIKRKGLKLKVSSFFCLFPWPFGECKWNIKCKWCLLLSSTYPFSYVPLPLFPSLKILQRGSDCLRTYSELLGKPKWQLHWNKEVAEVPGTTISF